MPVARTAPRHETSRRSAIVLVSHTRSSLSVLPDALVAFWRNNAMGMAGMIAFFGFLSLIPSILLLLDVLGHISVGPVSSYAIGRLFHDFVPGLSDKQFLDAYRRPVEHSRVATTVLGFVSLLFARWGCTMRSIGLSINSGVRPPDAAFGCSSCAAWR